ncbi:MAG: hypothetical protein RIC55_21730 [Pirellulaceae bacterium]
MVLVLENRSDEDVVVSPSAVCDFIRLSEIKASALMTVHADEGPIVIPAGGEQIVELRFVSPERYDHLFQDREVGYQFQLTAEGRSIKPVTLADIKSESQTRVIVARPPVTIQVLFDDEIDLPPEVVAGVIQSLSIREWTVITRTHYDWGNVTRPRMNREELPDALRKTGENFLPLDMERQVVIYVCDSIDDDTLNLISQKNKEMAVIAVGQFLDMDPGELANYLSVSVVLRAAQVFAWRQKGKGSLTPDRMEEEYTGLLSYHRNTGVFFERCQNPELGSQEEEKIREILRDFDAVPAIESVFERIRKENSP